MFSCREAVLAAALLCATAAQAQAPGQAATYAGVGRTATPKEIAAWDIDVRPDFKGLPKGAGSVAKGMEVWEAKCASCHGVFGESNQVFNPIVGGTTEDDIKTGRVARLNDRAYPGRTTLMKLSTLSTLWDYINRAMPWNAPKSLSTDEVYAVTAYILNLGYIVPDDFTLSDRNIAEVQQRLPNRNGMTTDHALWPGAGIGRRKPDVLAAACMSNCGPAPDVASFLPDFARDAHGNLAEQNRAVGAQRGAETTRAAEQASMTSAPIAIAATAASTKPEADGAAPAALSLLQKHGCVACHSIDSKLIGPSLRDISAKHAKRTDAVDYLAGKIVSGGSGVWGPMPMPAQTLGKTDATTIARWLADGAKK